MLSRNAKEGKEREMRVRKGRGTQTKEREVLPFF